MGHTGSSANPSPLHPCPLLSLLHPEKVTTIPAVASCYCYCSGDDLLPASSGSTLPRVGDNVEALRSEGEVGSGQGPDSAAQAASASAASVEVVPQPATAASAAAAVSAVAEEVRSARLVVVRRGMKSVRSGMLSQGLGL